MTAAKGEQLAALPQHIAHVQIKQQHKQGGGSKCDLSSGQSPTKQSGSRMGAG